MVLSQGEGSFARRSGCSRAMKTGKGLGHDGLPEKGPFPRCSQGGQESGRELGSGKERPPAVSASPNNGHWCLGIY